MEAITFSERVRRHLSAFIILLFAGAAARAQFTPAAAPFSVMAGDFNGDGKLDLAVANSGDNTVTVLLGDGTGGFSAAVGSPFAAGNAAQSLANETHADIRQRPRGYAEIHPVIPKKRLSLKGVLAGIECWRTFLVDGAGDEDRTRDVQLGNLRVD